MKYLQSRIFYSIFLYILILTIVFIKKPSLLFHPTGEIKQFGLNKNESIYSVGGFSIVLAIICFYIFCIIDIIFS
jgi:hypothetical protein